ncbi:MAG: hypothetical protein ABW133_25000 [Polyangiaceae bacterium]
MQAEVRAWRKLFAAAQLVASLLATSCSVEEPPQSQPQDAGTIDVSIDVSVDVEAGEPEPCGNEGEPCCVALVCYGGLYCNRNNLGAPGNVCVNCGNKNQPCCNNTCSTGLICQTAPDSTRTCVERPDAGTCSINCFPDGGRYCGRITNGCGVSLDCGSQCPDGLQCGGSGVANVCGARPDSGVCNVTTCETPAGKYCLRVGDGCGGQIDCGSLCPTGTECGASGVPNLCGRIDGTCAKCENGTTRYCGSIHDGCGQMLDCGECPGTQRCGEIAPNVCGLSCPECPLCDGDVTGVRGIAVTGATTAPDPVPGALVYVPRLAPGGTLPPLTEGRTCQQCKPIPGEDMIAWAITGPDGRFSLGHVPAGPAIPIVIQLGGWRRMTTIAVTACTANELPARTVRLPRNRSEGDIPLIALVTGSHDPLECVLRKMGIEDGEFTNPSGAGRIHVYRGNGAILDANTPDASSLFGGDGGADPSARYAQMLLPCRGAEIRMPKAALDNFNLYLDRGGRVLTTHFGYTWLDDNPVWSDFGTWARDAGAPPDPLVTDIATTAPRAKPFAAWLAATGALTRTSPPQMSIRGAHADLGTLGTNQELWMSSFAPTTTQLAIAGAPQGAKPDEACGRLAFADFHLAGPAVPGATFPSECSADLTLSPEEKALEYVLFDLASCTGARTTPPKLPPLPPRSMPPPIVPRPPPPNPGGPLGPSSENGL